MKSLRSVSLKLPTHDYRIVIGKNALKVLERDQWTAPSRAFILADSRLKDYSNTLKKTLETSGWNVKIYFVPATESFKNLEHVSPFYGRLLKDGADRHSVLFAVGGGVIGDAGGYLAGTYLRGIRWVGVPTTLLAQVDSSIGGKTGVNHAQGKNLIGIIHQPSLVICDTEVLKSLPQRERISGLGEIIKYGLLFDTGFFKRLQKNGAKILSLDSKFTTETIAQCAQFKARVVEKDELDRLGLREFLNFGHTVGHALEAATQFRVFRHGEAVILGMRAAIYLSWKKGHLEKKVFENIDSFLSTIPVPKIPKGLNSQKVMSHLLLDKKKSKDGKVRFVLLKDIGKPFSDSTVSQSEILEVISELRK